MTLISRQPGCTKTPPPALACPRVVKAKLPFPQLSKHRRHIQRTSQKNCTTGSKHQAEQDVLPRDTATHAEEQKRPHITKEPGSPAVFSLPTNSVVQTWDLSPGSISPRRPQMNSRSGTPWSPRRAPRSRHSRLIRFAGLRDSVGPLPDAPHPPEFSSKDAIPVSPPSFPGVQSSGFGTAPQGTRGPTAQEPAECALSVGPGITVASIGAGSSFKGSLKSISKKCLEMDAESGLGQ